MNKKIGVLCITLIIILLICFLSKEKNEKEIDIDIESYKYVKISGDSMSPTLNNNRLIKVRIKDYTPIKRNDLILFKYSDNEMIKRVIGLPYEHIKVEDNKLYINGEYLEESYLNESVLTSTFEYEIEDCYFVMGDNREISLDSRMFGCITEEDIIGKIEL